jgi:hypothetical protein
MKSRALILTLILAGMAPVNQLLAQRTPEKLLTIFRIENTDLGFRLDPGSKSLFDIKADLVRSVSVIKEGRAIDSAILKYGPKAKNGVILVYLKKDAAKDLPEKYRKMLVHGGDSVSW